MTPAGLADHAVSHDDLSHHNLTKRKYEQERHPYRTDFQRDRDRIVHSKAFRRLEYKTQVFVNHLGDNYRTRLTHSIEVSQIARTVARSLHLNEDLTETLALAHDLGHPPFGHAGERALHQLMKQHGGFDHNKQTLRIVTLLEQRYPDFEGLNLTEGTIIGLQKHSENPGEKGHTMESQVVDICDEVAYNNHDLDDGIDSGYLSLGQLDTIEIWNESWQKVKTQYPDIPNKIAIRYTIRSLIDIMVSDLIQNIDGNVKKYSLKSLDDVLSFHKNHPKDHKSKLVSFSENIDKQVKQLKIFLFENLYRHPDVVAMNVRAEGVVKRLFVFFTENPLSLPEEFQQRLEQGTDVHRCTADFIAGMTDRYALYWNKKVLGVEM